MKKTVHSWKDLASEVAGMVTPFEDIQISLSEKGEKYEIHPFILNTYRITSQFLSNSGKKLLIILPKKLDIPLWISFLQSLNAMKQDYSNNLDLQHNFKKGEKLRVGNCIVEYVEEGVNDKGYKTITIKCATRTTPVIYQLPWTDKSYFTTIKTDKKLSYFNKVADCLDEIGVKKHPLDKILNISSNGNPKYFNRNTVITTTIKDLKIFYESYKINNENIKDIFPTAKIDINGQLSPFLSEYMPSTPPLLVSYDLLGVEYFIENKPESTNVLIIDGAENNLIPNLSSFDLISSKDIPVIVFENYSINDDRLTLLKDKGFTTWIWNEDNLKAFNVSVNKNINTYPFGEVSIQVENTIKKQFESIDCSNSELENLIKKTSNVLTATEGTSTDKVNNIRYTLLGLINYISRSSSLPDGEYKENLSQTLENLFSEVEQSKIWLKESDSKNLLEVIEDLKNFNFDSLTLKDDKIESIKKYIEIFCKGKNILLITPNRNTDKEYQFWNKILEAGSMNKMKIKTIKEATGLEDQYFDVVIFPGWFGKRRMEPVVLKNMGENYTLFLYKIERDWYESASSSWSINDRTWMRKDDIQDIFKDIKVEFNLTDDIQEIKQPETEDVEDFEVRLRENYFNQIAAENMSMDSNVEQAKLVTFETGEHIFFTSTHSIYKVNNLIKKKSEETDKVTVDSLKSGDYIVIGESDKDFLRDLTEKSLISEGKEDYLEKAEYWQEALYDFYNRLGRNLSRVKTRLSMEGCDRHESTLKNWIFNKDQIGVQDLNDLTAIAKATGDDKLKKNLPDVIKSIKAIQSARQQVGIYLSKKLIEQLSQLLNTSTFDESKMLTEKNEIDLEEYGKAQILRVEDISDNYRKIDKLKINRVLRTQQHGKDYSLLYI